MLKIEKISPSVKLISALDPNLQVFDIIMHTKCGSTYNSYIIDGGDELALIDSAKEQYIDEYFKELEAMCDIRKIKYLIANHTEPDHSGEMEKLLSYMPWLTIVGTATAISFLKDITNKDFTSIEVKENTSLKVGNKTLSFFIVPYLHWPDSMFTYLEEENLLFTCDVFGAHYHTTQVYDDKVESQADYDEAFRYYYDCIFAPFKSYVLKALKQLHNKSFALLCPSHGPIIRKNKDLVRSLYYEWSVEEELDLNSCAIVYTSAYGYTKEMAVLLSEEMQKKGFRTSLFDLVSDSMEEAIQKTHSSGALLVGSPTINCDLVEPIQEFLQKLSPYKCATKLTGAFGSYGWSGEAVSIMEARLAQLKSEVYRPGIKIKFNPNSPDKEALVRTYGERFAEKLHSFNKLAKKAQWTQFTVGKWRCLVCSEIFEGDQPPQVCPACGAPQDQFIKIESTQHQFISEKEEHLVIIGAGIAGISAAQGARKTNPKAHITIISEEEEEPYYRILLSKKIGEALDAPLQKKEWFEKNNISLILGRKAEKIDINTKIITLNDKEELPYTKLILAMGAGANCILPQGKNIDNVFTLRNKKDFDSINKALTENTDKHAVVIGGGILGVEMALGLKKQNYSVCIVELAPRLMTRQLDETASQLLEKNLREQQIEIFTSEKIKLFHTDAQNKLCSVELESGKVLTCSLAIESLGVCPNTLLAIDAGITVQRGIVVDERMQTSKEDIFACGDIAQINGVCVGLWGVALEQGKVAGACAMGDENAFYHQKILATTVNINGYHIFSLGDLGQKYPSLEYQTLSLSDPQKKVYRKFYFREDQFVGGILMGETSKATQLHIALERSSTMQSFLDAHFLNESE
ncbi:MAG: FAD-dependent oxidoreductase [Candidatus Woesearchaeota archaeon]|nr:FAD-dependent oxidoreductase [Nanoarchaeota archaeon]USN43538.1 MAG: FAD-dependent oxidoreductase [Candidatus Woesearchaeota archaeon]